MRFGKMEIHLLDDGIFKIDGGAMFGKVPKVLWQKTNPADESNRVELSAATLLIRNDGKNILVDAGMGTKLTPKSRRIFGFKESGLLRALADTGLGPEDIHVVVLTHLHLDHAGGATRFNETGETVPVFSRAEYVVQEKEWEAATVTIELTAASYMKDDFLPLKEKGRLKLVNGDCRLTGGVTLKLTGGHSHGHQVVLLDSDGQKGVFPGDLVPTVSHLRLPYMTAFDLFPVELLEQKRDLIDKALRENQLFIWQHDPKVKMGYLYKQEDRVLVRELSEGGVEK